MTHFDINENTNISTLPSYILSSIINNFTGEALSHLPITSRYNITCACRVERTRRRLKAQRGE
jgi:hypothetical protein